MLISSLPEILRNMGSASKDLKPAWETSFMSIRTLFLYLIGNRQAIFDIAHCCAAIWVGMLFVLSAGFAREYDQEDLLEASTLLLAPLVLSFLTGSLLYAIVTVTSGRLATGIPTTKPRTWLAFLRLFWLTAPLAWLYAIPYEEFLSPLMATKANLITLGVVATWRVALMIRVVHVLYGFPLFRALCVVTLFGTILAAIGTSIAQLSIVGVMGGTGDLDESEKLVLAVTSILNPIMGYGLLVLIPAFCLSLMSGKVNPPEGMIDAQNNPVVQKSICYLAGFSLLIWAAVLPLTQPKQQLATKVSKLFHHDRPTPALELMASHERKDFPPSWEPPPRFSYWGSEDLAKLFDAVAAYPLPAWLRDAYLEKGARFIRSRHRYNQAMDTATVLSSFSKIPGASKLIQEISEEDSEAAQHLQEALTWVVEKPIPDREP